LESVLENLLSIAALGIQAGLLLEDPTELFRVFLVEVVPPLLALGVDDLALHLGNGHPLLAEVLVHEGGGLLLSGNLPLQLVYLTLGLVNNGTTFTFTATKIPAQRVQLLVVDQFATTGTHRAIGDGLGYLGPGCLDRWLRHIGVGLLGLSNSLLGDQWPLESTSSLGVNLAAYGGVNNLPTQVVLSHRSGAWNVETISLVHELSLGQATEQPISFLTGDRILRLLPKDPLDLSGIGSALCPTDLALLKDLCLAATASGLLSRGSSLSRTTGLGWGLLAVRGATRGLRHGVHLVARVVANPDTTVIVLLDHINWECGLVSAHHLRDKVAFGVPFNHDPVA